MSLKLVWQITAAISIPLLIVGLVLLVRAMRRVMPPRRTRCARCGYDRSGTPATPCPECGLAAERQRRFRRRRAATGLGLGGLLIVASYWNATRAVRAERDGWKTFVPTTAWLVAALRPNAQVALWALTERAEADETWWWQRDAMCRIAFGKVNKPTTTDQEGAIALLVAVFMVDPRPLNAEERGELATVVRNDTLGRARRVLDLLEDHGDLAENRALLRELVIGAMPAAGMRAKRVNGPLQQLFERRQSANGAFPDLAEVALDALAEETQAQADMLSLLQWRPEAVTMTPELESRLRELIESNDPSTSMLALQAVSALRLDIAPHAEHVSGIVDQALVAGDPLTKHAALTVARCPVEGELRWRVVEQLLSRTPPRTGEARWIFNYQPEWTTDNAARLRGLMDGLWGETTQVGPIQSSDLFDAIIQAEATAAERRTIGDR